MECIHVAATKFFPLLRGERFGAVLLVNVRRIAVPVTSVFTIEARRTAWSIDHQDFRRRVTAAALGCGLYGASRQIEQAVERFVGLDRRDLRGSPLAGHRMLHPPLKPQPTGTFAPAGCGEGGRHGSRPILSRRLPKEDVTDARAKVRCPADGERLDVEWRFLEPSGVVGDEYERTKTDLAAQGQTTTKNILMEIKKTATSPTSC